MNLPGTVITLGNGTLGRLAATEDGTSALILSGVAVGGQFALGDVLGPFVQLSDAEAKGINEAYDTTNTTVAWKHIKDFYDHAPAGTKLYVMVVAKTQTMTVTCTEATANSVKKLIEATEGNVKLLGITFTPDGTYTPTYSDQLEADLWTAITALKTTWTTQFGFKRPFRALVEARNFQGTIGSIKDLRGAGTTPAANMVHLILGNDYEYGAGAGYKSLYAAVGAALGRAAAGPVNRNIGRVKSGATLIVTGGLSNGSKISAATDANQNLLNDYGWIFLRKHIGKSGFYWNDDHAACVETDDYAQLSLGRVIDKAVRLVHAVNVEEILDEIAVDPATGKMDTASVKHYQAILENEINGQMTANQEISGVEVYVNPDQNVISTSKLTEVVKIVPTATGRVIETTVEYSNPLAN